MNRLLVVFGILFFAEAFHDFGHDGPWDHGGEWGHSGEWDHSGESDHSGPFDHNHDDPVPKSETKLEKIERKLIELENAFQSFCNEKKFNGTKELYGQDNYFLKYYLPEAKNSTLKVEVKHRLIHITAERNNNGQTDKLFEDVRILPEMVKFEDANWFESSGDIVTVTMPYKIPIGTETNKDCGVVNNNFITVPKAQLTIIPRSRD